jgi:hypothetical protein
MTGDRGRRTGSNDGMGNLALVGTEVDVTRGSPTDGVASDGEADTGGEGGERSIHYEH